MLGLLRVEWSSEMQNSAEKMVFCLKAFGSEIRMEHFFNFRGKMSSLDGNLIYQGFSRHFVPRQAPYTGRRIHKVGGPKKYSGCGRVISLQTFDSESREKV